MTNITAFPSSHGRDFTSHQFGFSRLKVRDYRSVGLGFSGLFFLNGAHVPIVAMGACPGEVYLKLANEPSLAAHRKDLFNIRILPIDWMAQAA